MHGFYRNLIALIVCAAPVLAFDAEPEQKAGRFKSVYEAREACRSTPSRVLGVVEPIRVVSCVYWEDGGSFGVEFVDARKRRFRMCLDQRLGDLVDTPPGTLFFRERPHHVYLGVMHPNDEGGLRVERLGAEEFAFYGLMLRWFEKHPEAYGVADRKGWIAASIDRDAAEVYHILIRNFDYRFTADER